MRNFIEHFTINIFKQGFGFLIVLNNFHYKIKLGFTRFDFVFCFLADNDARRVSGLEPDVSFAMEGKNLCGDIKKSSFQQR